MEAKEQSSQSTAKIVYLLMMVNIIIQFLGIIGVIIAYVNRGDAPEWLKSHYQFQIRTFWIGLVVMLLGFFFWVMGIGLFILIFWVVWLVMRCVKGMKYLDQHQAHPNPTTWLFT
jgi:uncharacterized membrane protein